MKYAGLYAQQRDSLKAIQEQAKAAAREVERADPAHRDEVRGVASTRLRETISAMQTRAQQATSELKLARSAGRRADRAEEATLKRIVALKNFADVLAEELSGGRPLPDRRLRAAREAGL